MSIETVIDVERGCGWRQPRGLYLVGGHCAADCGRLPIPLHVCLDEARRPCYEINKQGEWKPIIGHQAGLFVSFVPQAIHYICRGDEVDEELSALRNRGITPVRVQRMEQASMWDASAAAEAVA